MAKVLCPKCGGIAECSYEGEWGGGIDFFDHYSLHCNQCGHSVESEKVGSPYGVDDETTNCPFCGRSNLEHNDIAV